MVDLSNNRPSLIEAALGRRPSLNESYFFLAKKSLGSVHLIPQVRPKIIKLLIYFKLAIYVMKNVCFCAPNFLDPLLHCKCLQGFTGSLQGNQSAGISNLWDCLLPTIPVILESPYTL
jgi:hypothetical protein